MFSVENNEKGPPLTKSQKRRKRCRNCSFSLGLWLLFGIAVSKIIMGAEFGCSLDNKMIIYLVISGSVILLITVLFIAFIIAFGADVIFSKKMKKMMRVPIIVCLVHLPWLIVGSVWGFRNLKDVLDGCEGDCCDRVLVFFATSTLLIDWILTIVTIICIHYLDISRKKIMSLFFDEPPVFVDVGTQHEPNDDKDETINKEKPIFEDFIQSADTNETHIMTGKRVKDSHFAHKQFWNRTAQSKNTYYVRQSENSYIAQDNSGIVPISTLRRTYILIKGGITSVQENITNEVTSTPIETFQMNSPRSPTQTNRDLIQHSVAYNSALQSVQESLPNLADQNNSIKCDLLPSSTNVVAETKKLKTNGNGKSKNKTKKNKKT